MIFDRHDDSVFVSRTSPDGKHIASGGQDDRGFMFDMDGNLELAFIGHKGK
jgi:WD40 repeat protein